jgi:uncharacterized protein with HEPN domain
MDQGKKYLSDIIQALELIKLFTSGINDFEVYQSDLKTQSAVERQLGIIGEALNKFEKLYPEITLANAHKIVGLRNKLIHSYDNIDPSIIWVIISNYLPGLRKEVEAMLP